MLEKLAALQHAIWAHWMEYLFSVGEHQEDGSFLIPAGKVSRWKRQIDTAYQDLPEGEKESDRRQATKVFDLLEQSLEANREKPHLSPDFDSNKEKLSQWMSDRT